MIAVAVWQAILNGLGWYLARLYDFIPNYGVAIIILTITVRLLLLPLGVKQIRGMQATQALQPKMKALQQKYKGNRQKLNEEMMKLYKEHGYNPLSGCLPLVAQLPVLIALFGVLQYPKGLTHIPTGSTLFEAISTGNTHFLGANLLCSAIDAGKPKVIPATQTGTGKPATIDCGKGIPARIPYYVLSLLMVGSTYYQQRMMQKNSPSGMSGQQQTLMRIMPLLFGFWGFIFPAGLVVYWTTTNAIQIGQQKFLFSRGRKTPAAKPEGDGAGRRDGGAKQLGTGSANTKKKPRATGAGSSRSGTGRSGRSGRPRTGAGGQRSSDPKRSTDGGRRSGQNGGQAKGRSGGGDAGDRKKRPNR